MTSRSKDIECREEIKDEGFVKLETE